MATLQRDLSETRELNIDELDEVSGGTEKTTASYVDSHGVKHEVSNYDPD